MLEREEIEILWGFLFQKSCKFWKLGQSYVQYLQQIVTFPKAPKSLTLGFFHSPIQERVL